MAGAKPQMPLSIIYSKFDSYPFAADTEFNAGLQSILATAPGIEDEKVKSKVELQAKIYYFCRKFSVPPFSIDDYQSWNSSPAGDSEAEAASRDIASSINPGASGLIDALMGAGPSSKVAAEVAEGHEEEDGPPRLSYAELIELIQSGAPIPGIKDIPDTVLEGQGSAAEASKRRKPWEIPGSTANNKVTERATQEQIA